MLSRILTRLVREIYADVKNKEIRRFLRDDPEQVLIALLEEIKVDLGNVSSTLSFTVDRGGGGVLRNKEKQVTSTRKQRKPRTKAKSK